MSFTFRYEIVQCGDVEKLIKKREKPDDEPIYYVTIEDTYDTIKRAHLATGHGGRDRMIKELSKKYANITREALDRFKSFCQECQKKRKLTSKRAAEVAHQLLDIFLLMDAPSILQSDNGSEFTAEVIRELKVVWPHLVMVHGKPRHPQSQGSVERANGDIKDMLVAWMADNNTNDWSVRIKFVQFLKNSSLHSGIQRSPYSALFGCDAKVGLTTSSLPEEILERCTVKEIC